MPYYHLRLFLTSFMVLFLNATIGLAATLYVGDGEAFSTIQSAIDAANEGDVITVKNGTYNEHITIIKQVTIQSENGSGATYIDSYYNPIIEITSNNVTLNGFTIRGEESSADYAILLEVGVENCTIKNIETRNIIRFENASNNILQNNSISRLDMRSSSNNMISDNSFQQWSYSPGYYTAGYARLFESTSNEIYCNAFLNDASVKLDLDSDKNIVANNTFSGSDSSINGANAVWFLQGSDKNIIHGNEIQFYARAILLQGSSLSSLSGNYITDNTIASNYFAIDCVYAHSNVIAGNKCDSNNIGIWLTASNQNIIFGNILHQNSTEGLFINNEVVDNILYFNSFSNNVNVQYQGNTSNDWSLPVALYYKYGGSFQRMLLGNYFNDHSLYDSNGDGIGDNAYDLPGTEPDAQNTLSANIANYDMHAWWLESDNKLYQFSGNQGVGKATLGGGSAYTWISDEPAQTGLTFTGSNPWTGYVSFNTPPAANSILVEIGYSTNGTDFISGGLQALLGDGAKYTLYFTTNSLAFTVPAGNYLAVKVTNYTGVSYDMYQGYGASVVSPPDISCTAAIFFRDEDRDGYGDPSASVSACTHPEGYVSNNNDCNDSDAREHPGQTWYADYDEDGYSNGTINTESCSRPSRYYVSTELVAIFGDCNDEVASINPGEIEQCNGLDDNCNDQIDEGVKTTYFADMDGDGYGNSNDSVDACTNPSGYVENDSDCNDNNPLEHPGQIWFRDMDGDGYSDEAAGTTSCLRPLGYKAASELLSTEGDCDDGDPEKYPGQTWYEDSDGDGFGNPDITLMACERPDGFSLDHSDCDDGDDEVYPGHGCGTSLPWLPLLLNE